MTVEQLAAKLYEDGTNHAKRRVRKRCTMPRCTRVAQRTLDNREAAPKEIANLAAMDDEDLPNDSRTMAGELAEEGYSFAWLALLLPFIQLLLEFLANRAKQHLAAEGT